MTIIFDCDGVLVDSEPAEYAVDLEMLTAHGYRLPAAGEHRFVGIARHEAYRTIFAEMGRAIPTGLIEEVELRVQARHRAELLPMKGLLGALKSLRAVPKCVASSSTPASLALKLEVTGLDAEFGPHIYSTAQVARGKPAPDIWVFAAGCMRADPTSCIVVEDSRHGIAGAKAAGMRAIGFTGASRASAERVAELRAAGADCVITAMDDLPAAVKAMLP